MKYFMITVTSKKYQITPTMFVEKCSDGINNVDFVQSIEKHFNEAIPRAELEVRTIKRLNIFDFIHNQRTSFKVAGMIIYSKIEEYKKQKRREFFKHFFFKSA